MGKYIRIGKKAFGSNGKLKEIKIKMYKGVLDDVIGLPRNWIWELVNWDLVRSGEASKPTSVPEDRVMRIEVSEGLVEDVSNVPEGYSINVQIVNR